MNSSPCRHAESPAWSALIDATLTPRRRAIAAAHLDGCHDCGETVAMLRTIVSAAPELTSLQTSPTEWGSVRQAIGRFRRRRSLLRTVPLLAAASVLVVLGVARTAGRNHAMPSSPSGEQVDVATRRALTTLDAAITTATSQLDRNPQDPYLRRLLAEAQAARNATVSHTAAILRKVQ